MCTVLLSPGVNPIAVNKYTIWYQNIYQIFMNYEAHKYQLLLNYTNTTYVYCNTEAGSRKALLPRKRRKYYLFWVCVCSLSYPTYNARGPYYIVRCGLSAVNKYTIRYHNIYQIFMNYEAHKYQLLLKYTNTIYIYCNTEAGSRKALLPRKRRKYYLFWVCVCSLSYPTRNARVLYYIVICGLSGSTTYFHIIS